MLLARHWKYIILGSLAILGIEAFYFKPSFVESKSIVVKIPTPSPTPPILPTPSETPTVKPTVRPTKAPTPTPQPKVSSQEINQFIDQFAGQYGISPHVLRYMALCESGFNPNAKNLSYLGLYQYGVITWKNLRTQMGENIDPNLRANALEAVKTTAYALSKGKFALWPNCKP